jgi:exopolyphosphatase / guanosine-5'-triphosphate,3'-diphosphate pyrophosphatase
MSQRQPARGDDVHYAAIDVGSNAARLKVARLHGGRLEVVHAERAAVRPGEGVFSDGVIGDAVTARLGETLARFAETCRFYRAELRAVATSAVRSAGNRLEVVAALQRQSGVTLEILSGADEARLMCLGVRGDLAGHERALCIDVGGGSTEVVLARGARPERLWSVEAGALRLGERHGDDLPALRAAARAAVAALGDTDAVAVAAPSAVIGCSGSARALVAFATADARRWATVHELAGAADELARMRPKRRLRFFSASRAAVILPAAALLEAVMRRFDVYALRSTKRGLRDGIIFELSRGSATDAVMNVAGT